MAKETCTSPSRDEIARRAYEIYAARGCKGGSAHEDWIRAETELRGKLSKDNKTKATLVAKNTRRDGRSASAR